MERTLYWDTGDKGMKCRLSLSGNRDGVVCGGVMLKEEMCENVSRMRRVSDRVMADVLVF